MTSCHVDTAHAQTGRWGRVEAPRRGLRPGLRGPGKSEFALRESVAQHCVLPPILSAAGGERSRVTSPHAGGHTLFALGARRLRANHEPEKKKHHSANEPHNYERIQSIKTIAAVRENCPAHMPLSPHSSRSVV
ncbi:hypothetical protein MRX96_023324 [Rhipicephalus microplus]